MGLREKTLLGCGIGMTLANRAMLIAGLRKPRDGWRRGAGLVLRQETATFILSSFSVNFLSDFPNGQQRDQQSMESHFENRLASFLAAETDCHARVRCEANEDSRQASPGPCYTVVFSGWVDGAARFLAPMNWPGEPKDALLKFIVRLHPTRGADVWMRVNHVGADGVPMQEVLSRLESSWGLAEATVFPTPTQFEEFSTPRDCRGRAGIVQIQSFVNLQPLLDWRKRVNVTLPEPIPLSAAILWAMTQHPAFENHRFGSTVEIPEVNGLMLAVGVIVIRPADYRNRPNGLAEYVREFSRQIELNKKRESDGCKLLDAAAFLPAKIERVLLEHGLRGDRAFGLAAISIIRDAKVFCAPIGDLGHDDGFFAIGSAALPATDGTKVCSICIKGPKQRVIKHAEILSAAIGSIE